MIILCDFVVPADISCDVSCLTASSGWGNFAFGVAS